MSQDSQVERLSKLISASAAVVGEVDLDRVLRRLVTEARATTGAEYAALGVLGDHGVLAEFIHEGLPEGVADRIGSLPQGRGVLGTVVRERRTIILDDLGSHPDSFGFPEHHPFMGNFLGVPVMAGDDAFGNLYLTNKPGGFDPEDARSIEALARIAGSAVNTARLRDQLEALAVVQDRNRIARDLHDSIIQDLFAIGLTLQSMTDRVDDSAAGLLHAAVDRLDDTVESLRAYIYDLKSATRQSLEDRVKMLVRRYRSAYPNVVQLAFDIEAEPDPFAAEQVEMLVSEALSNALRHSGPGDIDVSVTTDDGMIFLQIRDSGVGFDPEIPAGGLGLAGMRDRVQRMSGEIEITSAPGDGTEVAISLPGS